MTICEECREYLIEDTTWIGYNNVLIAEIEYSICKKCGKIEVDEQKFEFDNTDERLK